MAYRKIISKHQNKFKKNANETHIVRSISVKYLRKKTKSMYLQSNKISHINTGQHMKKHIHSFNKKNIQFSKEILQKLKCDNQNIKFWPQIK